MAQCAGTTQKGDRCRRDAREGSAYCAVHLEQEGRPRPEHPKTPWTTDDKLKAALGFGILAALALFRFRR
ncbi:MAG: hypothetical protein ABL963_01905 [Longimicrobiales bacterium]